MNGGETIPITALLDASRRRPNSETDPRSALRAAEVIIGVDDRSDREFIVYGRNALEEKTRTSAADALRILKIRLDQNSAELQWLLTLVEAVKGHHDYQAG
jgi:hypothetical protein